MIKSHENHALFLKQIKIVENFFFTQYILVQENFNPERKCFENEYECENSYGYKICVEEKNKIVACAKYSKKLCSDDEIYFRKFDLLVYIFTWFVYKIY